MNEYLLTPEEFLFKWCHFFPTVALCFLSHMDVYKIIIAWYNLYDVSL